MEFGLSSAFVVVMIYETWKSAKHSIVNISNVLCFYDTCTKREQNAPTSKMIKLN